MKNVGFILTEGLITWNGGINYYRNLITILNESKDYHPIIFTSTRLKDIMDKRFNDIEIYYCNFLTSGTMSSKLRNLGVMIGYVPFVEKVLREKKVSIISHNSLFPLNKFSRVKNLMWIPDFQQQYLPYLFTRKTRIKQTILNNICINRATKIVVSSYDAKKDLLKFYPRTSKKDIEIMQFSLPPRTEYENSSKELEEKYKLSPYSYFLVTNQFWKHKNHKVILEALSILKKQNKLENIKVIATGLMLDPRNEDYTNELKEIIREDNLENIFINVGNIPYPDVLLLQNYCMAVIQPSNFEGWNTSVEECKQIGKKIILSNIEVHKEQNPANVQYFDNKKPEELAGILAEVNNSFRLELEMNYYKNAQKEQYAKWESYKHCYLSILDNL